MAIMTAVTCCTINQFNWYICHHTKLCYKS